MVSREYDGLAGAGGVKDVCRQLAETLVRQGGCSVHVVLPRYGFLDAYSLGFRPLSIPASTAGGDSVQEEPCSYTVDMNYISEERREEVSVWQQTLNGVSVLLLEAERFAEKGGVYTYTPEEEGKTPWQRRGMGHFDYFAMNILLQKASLDLLILLSEHPDVIHCQDGHAATLPAIMREHSGYRHYFRRTGAVVTIHNAGLGYHQEVADLRFAHAVTGLPLSIVQSSILGGNFDPFIAGAFYAVVNTVSENYARELQTSNEDKRTGWLGHRLLRRGVKLAGVTNGINPEDFDPRAPVPLGLAAQYDPLHGDFAGKKICKSELLRSLQDGSVSPRVQQYGSLDIAVDTPLLTFIGRLTEQKGVDVLLQALEILLAEDADFQMLFLGSGDAELEERCANLTSQKSALQRVCFCKGYDPALANRIYAAGDFFLIPSLYEPCGLTDYIAQLLGNLPIVHHVGGLVKVLDGETGFVYLQHAPSALKAAIERSLALYRTEPETILSMQQAAVQCIHEQHTWSKVMEQYFALYERALHAVDGR